MNELACALLTLDLGQDWVRFDTTWVGMKSLTNG